MFGYPCFSSDVLCALQWAGLESDIRCGRVQADPATHNHRRQRYTAVTQVGDVHAVAFSYATRAYTLNQNLFYQLTLLDKVGTEQKHLCDDDIFRGKFCMRVQTKGCTGLGNVNEQVLESYRVYAAWISRRRLLSCSNLSTRLEYTSRCVRPCCSRAAMRSLHALRAVSIAVSAPDTEVEASTVVFVTMLHRSPNRRDCRFTRHNQREEVQKRNAIMVHHRRGS